MADLSTLEEMLKPAIEGFKEAPWMIDLMAQLQQKKAAYDKLADNPPHEPSRKDKNRYKANLKIARNNYNEAQLEFIAGVQNYLAGKTENDLVNEYLKEHPELYAFALHPSLNMTVHRKQFEKMVELKDYSDMTSPTERAVVRSIFEANRTEVKDVHTDVPILTGAIKKAVDETVNAMRAQYRTLRVMEKIALSDKEVVALSECNLVGALYTELPSKDKSRPPKEPEASLILPPPDVLPPPEGLYHGHASSMLPAPITPPAPALVKPINAR